MVDGQGTRSALTRLNSLVRVQGLPISDIAASAANRDHQRSLPVNRKFKVVREWSWKEHAFAVGTEVTEAELLAKVTAQVAAVVLANGALVEVSD